MTKLIKALAAAAAACAVLNGPNARADHLNEDGLPRPDDHAPIGVMGDHLHDKGEWMLSYRFMRMDMSGNRDGTDSLTPEEIATTAPNRFFGMPGQPPTLRVVPVEMTMDMHMFGAMYAPSDRVTLMLMVNYLDNEMDHITFAGGMGSARLGTFTTESSGFGDTRLTSLISLYNTPNSKLHAIVGVEAPTGSTDETDDILTPMGMRPTVRLPYPMQLGTGSWSAIVGLNQTWYADRFSVGAQWQSAFRLNENSDDYTRGDEHRLNLWGAWRLAQHISASARLEGFYRGNIDGQDPRIMGPVQTADPDRQRARRLDLGLGLNYVFGNSRIALEWLNPIYQDLDGPQLEVDSSLILGWQYAF
ncbi:MAG: transporter [Pseudomonadota bacterium]